MNDLLVKTDMIAGSFLRILSNFSAFCRTPVNEFSINDNLAIR